MKFADMLDGYKKLNDKYDLTLWCILGGDVTVFGRDKLHQLTEFFNEQDIFYAYVSNSTLLDEEWVDDLMGINLSNWTVSLDSLQDIIDTDRNSKALAALRAINMFSERGLQDIHCTVTLDRKNIVEAPDMVRWLTSKGVWAEITPLHYSKSEHYDFGSAPDTMPDYVFKEEDKQMIDEIMKELVAMKAAGFLVHNLDAYLLSWSKYVVDLSWQCSNMWNLTVDADGSFRPCLHLHGNKIRSVNVSNIDLIPHAEIMKKWDADIAEQCQGCLWNCQFETEYIWERTQSLEMIDLYFKHGCKAVEEAMDGNIAE